MCSSLKGLTLARPQELLLKKVLTPMPPKDTTACPRFLTAQAPQPVLPSTPACATMHERCKIDGIRLSFTERCDTGLALKKIKSFHS